MDFSFKDFSWQTFSFEYYGILILLLLSLLFLLFEYFPGRNYFYSIQSLKRFIDKHLIQHLVQGSETRRKSWLRSIVVSLVWFFLVLAIANPRWDYEQVEGFKPNINLVILLDVSKSMDARDEKPSRLERAKQEINDIVKKAEAANIGLIAFADQAHIISPVTDDKNAIQYLLPSMSTDLVGVQGSNIKAGLRSADLLLKPLEGGINYILVMSDGGFENISELPSLGKSVKNGKVITFGFGGTEGAPIPDAEGKFIVEDGKTVMTKLEKQNLILLSGLDNFIQSTYLDDDTAKVVGIISKNVEALKTKTKLYKIWHERFYIPLMLAILLVLPFFRRGAIFPIVLLLLSTPSFAQDDKPSEKEIEKPQIVAKSKVEMVKDIFKNKDQQAKDLFDERQYMEAEKKFSGSYNRGVSAYRNGDYEKAERYFSFDKDMNISSEYNMGNAQLQQMKLEECIKTYQSVLKKDPNFKDAQTNLDICKKLKNNPQNQNQSKDKSDQDDKDKQDKDKEKDKQDQNDKDKNKDQQNDKGQGGNDQKESDGNQQKKELDIQAKSILSKISSDPSRLMKNRFQYEDAKGDKSGKAAKRNSKPW